MKLENKNRSGVTLVELLLALSLVSIILLISFNFFFSGLNNYARQVDSVENQTNAKRVIRDISLDLRKADRSDIKISDDNQKINISGTIYSFNSDSNTIMKMAMSMYRELKNLI